MLDMDVTCNLEKKNTAFNQHGRHGKSRPTAPNHVIFIKQLFTYFKPKIFLLPASTLQAMASCSFFLWYKHHQYNSCLLKDSSNMNTLSFSTVSTLRDLFQHFPYTDSSSHKRFLMPFCIQNIASSCQSSAQFPFLRLSVHEKYLQIVQQFCDCPFNILYLQSWRWHRISSKELHYKNVGTKNYRFRNKQTTAVHAKQIACLFLCPGSHHLPWVMFSISMTESEGVKFFGLF